MLRGTNPCVWEAAMLKRLGAGCFALTTDHCSSFDSSRLTSPTYLYLIDFLSSERQLKTKSTRLKLNRLPDDSTHQGWKLFSVGG